jgi:hypothetical protein
MKKKQTSQNDSSVTQNLLLVRTKNLPPFWEECYEMRGGLFFDALYTFQPK